MQPSWPVVSPLRPEQRYVERSFGTSSAPLVQVAEHVPVAALAEVRLHTMEGGERCDKRGANND